MIIRIMDLPPAVNGFVTHCVEPDGDYDVIVLNARHSREKQLQTLKHECRHIDMDHFYRDMTIEEMEREAEGF